MLPRRVLLVSDFVTEIGGIERVLHSIRRLLMEQGVDVMLAGHTISYSVRLEKLLCLLLSYNNRYAAAKLRKQIDAYEPDLIWLHSVSRYYGPAIHNALYDFSGTVWMTYHDYGYVHPFASAVYHERDIPVFRQKDFCQSAGNVFWRRLYARLKYTKLQALRKSLVSIVDVHTAPSPSTAKIMQDSRHIDTVRVLPHFYRTGSYGE